MLSDREKSKVLYSQQRFQRKIEEEEEEERGKKNFQRVSRVENES